MSLPSLLSRIQALEAQSRMPSAATTATPQTPTAGTTFIPPVQVANGSAASGWTTFNVAPYVPSTATAVLLEGYFSNSSGSTTGAFFYVRSAPTQTTPYFLGYTISGAGNDTSSCPGRGSFPIAGGAFQWMTNTGNMNYVVNLIGYEQ